MIMQSNAFVQEAINIANNYNTVYMWGEFGSPVTQDVINMMAAQYPDWYTSAKKNLFVSLIGQDYFGFDCIGLIKGILWGWSADRNRTWGGVTYPTDSTVATGLVMPDIGADHTISVCTEVSSNFSKIVPGEVVWMSGHIGIYIGSGKAVECSPAWVNKCQITAVGNIGTVSGLNTRTWTKHGKLPWIKYSADSRAWPVIINAVTNKPADWATAVSIAMDASVKAGLASLSIFEYLGTLIEKVDSLPYTTDLTWIEIVDKVATKSKEWQVAINAAVGAAKAPGDIGALEIFAYLPDLIVKIYNSNK